MNCHKVFCILMLALVSCLAYRPTVLAKTGIVHRHHVRVFLTHPGQRGAFGRSKPPSQAPPPPVNGNIQADPVRLIAPKTGGAFGEEEMLGIYALDDALEKANEMELDLVLINEKADPPVCKIIDYGKYKYALERKKRENAKKQVKSSVKEVKMSYKIDIHDFDVRVRAALKFLAEGDKVKVVVQFKGREMQHKELGQQVMTRYFAAVADSAVVESPATMEGRSMFMLLAPKKGSEKKATKPKATSTS